MLLPVLPVLPVLLVLLVLLVSGDYRYSKTIQHVIISAINRHLQRTLHGYSYSKNNLIICKVYTHPNYLLLSVTIIL